MDQNERCHHKINNILYDILHTTRGVKYQARCAMCDMQGDHSADNVKFPGSRDTSAALGILSVTHIMPVLMLNTCTGTYMQLYIQF